MVYTCYVHVFLQLKSLALDIFNTSFRHCCTTIPHFNNILVNFLIDLILWRVNKIVAFYRVFKVVYFLIGDVLYRIRSYLPHIATKLSWYKFFLRHYLSLRILVFNYLSVAVVILHLHKSTGSLIQSTRWVAVLLGLGVLRIFRLFWSERVSVSFTFTLALTASQSMVWVCQYFAA